MAAKEERRRRRRRRRGGGGEGGEGGDDGGVGEVRWRWRVRKKAQNGTKRGWSLDLLSLLTNIHNFFGSVVTRLIRTGHL